MFERTLRTEPVDVDPDATGYLFDARARRLALVYGAVVIIAATALGTLVHGERAYLTAWVAAAALFTTPAFWIVVETKRRVAEPQKPFWRIWLIGLALVYACGVGILFLQLFPIDAIKIATPFLAVGPILVYGIALGRSLQDKSGVRDHSVDLLDAMVAAGVIAAPGLLWLIGPLAQTSAAWYAIPAALIAAVMPGAIVETSMLFARLPKGERQAEGIGIAIASVSALNAVAQVAQSLSGFTLPSAPLIALQCANMGLLALLPLYCRKVPPLGLDRLPTRAQVRRHNFVPLIIVVVVPVLIAETLAVQSEKPWAVAFSLAVLGLLVLLGLGRELLASRETRRLYLEVESLADERKQLLANLMRAVEHDRHRMAAQLHEQAVGGLVALGSVIRASSAALPADVSARFIKALDTTRADLATQVEALRQLMLAVRPPVLEDQSMTAAIMAFASETFAEGPRVSLEVNVDPDLVLDWTTETIIYRITQDALQNVRRHAGATAVLVEVTAPGDFLEVVVQDDGRGFDPDAVLYESGIATMRLFASLGRGRLELTSAPGEGTTVHVTLGVADPPDFEEPAPRGSLHLVIGGADTPVDLPHDRSPHPH